MKNHLDYNRVAKKILEQKKTNIHKKLCLQLLEKSLEINPNFFGTYYLLGIYYYDLKDFLQSEYNYKKSIELNKNNTHAYLNLFSLYYFSENFVNLFYLIKIIKNNIPIDDFEFPIDMPMEIYVKNMYPYLKFKFNNSELIENNYSQSYQDMFILSILNGKENGTYLEIGSGSYFFGNNTFLLEKQFGWKGVSIEIEEVHEKLHNKKRKNKCFNLDATQINYETFLSEAKLPNVIDYLQLDCDPPEITYEILTKIPFDSYKFAIITYEHDYYIDETKSFQEKSRQYLESYGYIRVVNNVSIHQNNPFEDWWVHPDIVDQDTINKMIYIDNTNKKVKNYFFIDETSYSHKNT